MGDAGGGERRALKGKGASYHVEPQTSAAARSPAVPSLSSASAASATQADAVRRGQRRRNGESGHNSADRHVSRCMKQVYVCQTTRSPFFPPSHSP